MKHHMRKQLSLFVAVLVLFSSSALAMSEGKQGQTLAFPEYDLTISKVSTNRFELEATFELTIKKAHFLSHNERLYFEARAGDTRIQYLGISFSREDKGEGENRFIGLYDLKPLGRLPEEVTFLPYIEKMTPTSPGNNPIIENTYLEDNAFTVKLSS